MQPGHMPFNSHAELDDSAAHCDFSVQCRCDADGAILAHNARLHRAIEAGSGRADRARQAWLRPDPEARLRPTAPPNMKLGYSAGNGCSLPPGTAACNSPAATRPPVRTTPRTPHLNRGPILPVRIMQSLKPVLKRSIRMQGVRSPVSPMTAVSQFQQSP